MNLQTVKDIAAEHFKSLFVEALPDIERALIAAAEEAQNQDTEAKLSIGFRVTINLDKNAVSHDLSFGVRHKLSSCASVDDPAQGKLDGITSFTVKTNPGTPEQTSVTLDHDQIKRASERLKRFSGGTMEAGK